MSAPTEPGWYWVRIHRDDEWEPVCIRALGHWSADVWVGGRCVSGPISVVLHGVAEWGPQIPGPPGVST